MSQEKMQKNLYTPQNLSLFSKPKMDERSYSIDNLSGRNQQEILAEFQKIPFTTAYLLLDTNDLYAYISEATHAFSVIPIRTHSLDLSFNCLGDNQTEDKLPNLFAAIPEHVTSINLSGNYLSNKSEMQLEQAFQAMHRKMISINLSFNSFNEQPINKLIQLTKSLPSMMEVLNLSGNYLHDKPTAELDEFFSTLSAHNQLKQIDLRDNYFDEKEMAMIKTYLSFVGKVIFLDTDLQNNEENQCQTRTSTCTANTYGMNYQV